MSYGTDYHWYKYKLERLQCKVQRSETARKELELRLETLMKERNECEKSASIHKSNYHTLLNNERTRLSRNEELLQMLETVQAKAANLASNTERLKTAKNQQERILINNWRRNACLQHEQQMFYPNVLHPNTVQYLLSSPSVPISSHPTVIARDTSTSSQSFIDEAKQQHKFSPSLMSIYQSEPFHPIYNNYYARSHELPPPPQPYPIKSNVQINTYEPATRHMPPPPPPSTNPSMLDRAFNPMDMQKIHIGYNNQLLRDRNENPMQIYENYTLTSRSGQRSTNTAPFPIHLNKSQQYRHHQYYSPTESINTNQIRHSTHAEPIINRFSFGDESLTSQMNVPTNSTDVMMGKYTHLSRHMNKTNPIDSLLPEKYRKNESIYDENNALDMFANKMSDRRGMNANANVNVGDIDFMNANDKYNERFERNRNNDVRANANESIDLTKSIDDYTTRNVPSAAAASSSYAKRTPTMATSTTAIADVSSERDHYPYESTLNRRMYGSAQQNEPNVDDDTIDRTRIVDDNVENVMANSNNNTDTLFPNENQHHSSDVTRLNGKRRSSIDANSFAKTLGYDTDLEKQSIAANLRRRYSVAANFLNLPSNTMNDTSSLDLRPNEATTNEYRNDGTSAWLHRNIHSTTVNPANEAEQQQIGDSLQIQSNDNGNGNAMHSKISFDTNAISSIGTNRNGSAIAVHNQIDAPMVASSPLVTHTLPIDNNDGYQSQGDTNNHQQYDNNDMAPYTMDDQTYVENAMEHLKLDDNNEQHRSGDEMKTIQFDDGMDRSRASGKTVTWADDPQSNYKNLDPTQSMYEAQNITSVDENSLADPYYANQSDTQQIQQHDYIPMGEILPAAGANESSHYQYDNVSQYDDGQYQYQAPDAGTTDGAIAVTATTTTTTDSGNQNLYMNSNENNYYYPNEQMNQYDQYAVQPEASPQQQQHHQQQQEQMQYYATNDAAQIAEQQFQGETTLQPKQDDYYTVSPGENYYTDYDNSNQNQNYALTSNTQNAVHAVDVNVMDQQKIMQPSQSQRQQQAPQIQAQPIQQRQIPNYLQSDTDDSQIGYQNQPTNNSAPQSHDSTSDFDFSTNS